MFDFIKNLLRPKYKTLNRIVIDKQNILHNYNYLKSLQADAEIFPVLKSNAYGHRLKEMCKILSESSAKMIIVDSFPEAQIVYKYSNKKALIISEMPFATYKYCDFSRTEFVVYNIATLKFLAKSKVKPNIHLFVNTGMNREGIGDFEKFIAEAKDYFNKVNIIGVCSHLASADDISVLNQKQQDKFFDCLDLLRKNGIYPKWVHLANSAGTFILKDNRFTAFRAGISLYGYNVFSKNHPEYKSAENLKPALSLYSTVISVQKINLGDAISYNETFHPEKEGNIAVIPFGYFEGLDRRLSNKAKFLVKTRKKSFYARIAGRVCMNITCLDCGDNKVEVGDEVEIISSDPSAKNSIQSLADIMGTIPYEILVKLQGNIYREVV